VLFTYVYKGLVEWFTGVVARTFLNILNLFLPRCWTETKPVPPYYPEGRAIVCKILNNTIGFCYENLFPKFSLLLQPTNIL
jgi:hypothetical protein